jgi:hypothetical protein
VTSAAHARATHEQALWSTIAGKLKDDLGRWRRYIMLALISAAVLAAAAGALPLSDRSESIIGVVAAFVVVVAPFVRAVRLSKGAFQNWTRARSASEALKQEIFEYATGTGDYRAPTTRDEVLDGEVDRIVSRVDDLAGLVDEASVPQKKRPEQLSISEYLSDRVASQVRDYYRPKADAMAHRERLLRWLEWALAGAAVVGVVLAAALGRGAALPWIGVVTTVSGALLSHREAERYEYLAISYTVTANRLDGLLEKWTAAIDTGPLTPAQEDLLVAECEDAISVENQAWMATWTDAPRGV